MLQSTQIKTFLVLVFVTGFLSFQNCSSPVSFQKIGNEKLSSKDVYEEQFKTSTIDEQQLEVTVGPETMSSNINLDANTIQHSQTLKQLERPQHTEMYKQGQTATAYSDKFSQKGSSTGLLDILVVIDNSGSMRQEQKGMADRMAPLLSEVQDSDWRIGVVTTDAGDSCMRAVISKGDQNAEQKYRDAINAGTQGSGHEEGVHKAIKGLGCTNPKWIRSGSSLAVLFVTDEDDDSGETQEDLFNKLRGLNRTIGKDSRVYALLNPSQTGHYSEIVDDSKGISGSIETSDYTPILSAISENVSTILKNQFQLSAKPDSGTLSIQVNGKKWTHPYKVEGTTLTFQDTLPPKGSEILVDYESGGVPIKKSFPLSHKPLANSTEVLVNGKKAAEGSYQIDRQNGKLIFEDAPPERAEIIANYKEDIPLSASFALKSAKALPGSLEVKINGKPTRNYSYMKDSQMLYFEEPPSEGAEIQVAYEEFDSPVLNYSLPFSSQNSEVLDVYDASTGESIAHTVQNGSLSISPGDYKYQRSVKVEFLNKSSQAVDIQVEDQALTDTVQVQDSSNVCQVMTQPLRVHCDTLQKTKAQVSYKVEKFNTAFSLNIPETMDLEKGSWEVILNGDPITNFERNANKIVLPEKISGGNLLVRFLPEETR